MLSLPLRPDSNFKLEFLTFLLIKDTLSTMRNKQDVAFILLKKVISSSKCREEYKDDIKEIDDLIKESENIFENYNKKTSSYNAFIRFFFARPYEYFAKKKTYPLIY